MNLRMDEEEFCERCHKPFGFSGEDENGINCTCVHCGNNTYYTSADNVDQPRGGGVMKLKPCPMCGPGNSVVELYKNEYGKWQIACGACGLHSGIMPDNNIERLIKQWNQRPYFVDIEP